MMQEKDKQRDFISRAGMGMTVIAWIIFLAMMFGLFDYLVEQRNNPNQNIVTTVDGRQKEIVLQRNAYGHYVSNGTINGNSVVFLLDTRTSDIAIPASVAEEIGLHKGREVMIKTANGNARAYRTRLESVAIGEIELYDLNATILTNITGREDMIELADANLYKAKQSGGNCIVI